MLVTATTSAVTSSRWEMKRSISSRLLQRASYGLRRSFPACQVEMRHFVLCQREVEFLVVGICASVNEQRDGVSLLIDLPECPRIKRLALLGIGRCVGSLKPFPQFRIARIV